MIFDVPISITSCEKTMHERVFLLRHEVDSWCYILVEYRLLGLFSSVTKFLPLKIKLLDYGQIIHSGSGTKPPSEIIRQIEYADFSQISEPQIFCLLSTDQSGQEFYTYLEVPYYLVKKLEADKSSNACLNFLEYGRILNSGWGKPEDSVKQMVREQYGVDTPELEPKPV